MKAKDVSVIISTYNQPKWLQKVLWSYEQQIFKDFEVVIADDGSGEETKGLIDKMKLNVSYPIQHIWHEDNGFQKDISICFFLLACLCLLASACLLLPARLLTRLLTRLLACLPACLLVCLLACPLACLPAWLVAYFPA